MDRTTSSGGSPLMAGTAHKKALFLKDYHPCTYLLPIDKLGNSIEFHRVGKLLGTMSVIHVENRLHMYTFAVFDLTTQKFQSPQQRRYHYIPTLIDHAKLTYVHRWSLCQCLRCSKIRSRVQIPDSVQVGT
jgi:hypothetical protein